MKRASDITIADFWGIEKFEPEFVDKKGISLVIVNTKKGEEIFNKIKDKIKYIAKSKEEAEYKNPQLRQPIGKDEENRKKFWNKY